MTLEQENQSLRALTQACTDALTATKTGMDELSAKIEGLDWSSVFTQLGVTESLQRIEAALLSILTYLYTKENEGRELTPAEKHAEETLQTFNSQGLLNGKSFQEVQAMRETLILQYNKANPPVDYTMLTDDPTTEDNQ